jgi:hypothetical protein
MEHLGWGTIAVMIQVSLRHTGAHDVEGNELPRLVYVSREKRPGYQHHKKAGAMNTLVRLGNTIPSCFWQNVQRLVHMLHSGGINIFLGGGIGLLGIRQPVSRWIHPLVK